MNITGTASRKDGSWVLKSADGQEWRLVGGDLKPRMEGLTLRVVGVEEDNFGDSFFGGPRSIVVQHLKVV